MSKLAKKEVQVLFDEWFTINIPESWTYDVEEDLLSIAASKNPKGIIQISYFNRKDKGVSEVESSKTHLKRFIRQYEIDAEEGKITSIEGKDYVIANISGIDEGHFIEAWSIVNKDKLLLVTYGSPKKTRELEVAEKIVYSINFNL